ncbi:hypothetical protein E4U53_006109 [Claviceps sorghi]|nr:hypothetical protein E4U53_006109 [Claviceps sorghi]
MTKSGKPLPERFQDAIEPQLDHGHHDSQKSFLPQTPPIAYHGLTSPTPPYDRGKPDKALLSTARLNRPQPCRENGRSGVVSPILWQSQSNGRTDIKLTSLPLPAVSSCAIGKNGGPSETFDGHVFPWPYGGREPVVSISSSIMGSAQRNTSKQPITSSDIVRQHQFGLILDGQRPELSNDETVLPQLVLSPTTLNATGMPQVRDKIRRQLGQLFVYPLVYMTGWLIPFISHVVGGDKTGRPFWLVLASLISLCTQGLADSVVFLVMEKPWRYWTRDDVTAWCCFWWSKQSSMKGTGIKVGRTREEMLIDGTIARRRRERERAERRLRSAGRGPKFRDWWDHTLVEIDESNDEDEEAEADAANSMG